MVSSVTPLCPKELEDKSVLFNASISEKHESNCLNLEDANRTTTTNLDVKNKLSRSVLITKNGISN